MVAPTPTPPKKVLTPTRQPVDVSAYFASPEDTKNGFSGNILIHGKMKAGKTFLAASASGLFPPWDKADPFKSVLPAKKKTVLEDMIWVSFDAGALDGLKQCNLSIPDDQHIVFQKVLGKLRASDALKKVAELISGVIAKKPHVRWMVGDTVSQADSIVLAYFCDLTDQEAAESEPGEKKNAFAPYKLLHAAHAKFHGECQKMPVQKIWLCHSKNLMEGVASGKAALNAENTKKAHRMVGSEPIVPDITGKNHAVYEGNASIIGVQKFIIAPGGDKSKGKRIFMPYGGEGFEGGNRFHELLNDEEPSHLGFVFNKLAA